MARRDISKKAKKSIVNGRVYIMATFNNTIVTVTDDAGAVICWSSAGSLGFRGVKKSTPYAAQATSEAALQKALTICGLERVAVFIKGPGTGRDSAVRTVANMGLSITSLHDITPIPHNGCRPRNVRRP